nr:hypothetical protein [Tanacetum cinerariifolium]
MKQNTFVAYKSGPPPRTDTFPLNIHSKSIRKNIMPHGNVRGASLGLGFLLALLAFAMVAACVSKAVGSAVAGGLKGGTGAAGSKQNSASASVSKRKAVLSVGTQKRQGKKKVGTSRFARWFGLQDEPVQTQDDPVQTKDQDQLDAYKININNELSFDPEMHALENISTVNFSSNQEDADEEAAINNMDTTIQVSPTPTTRIHNDHLHDQVIGDMHSTTQTRNMSKDLEDHGFVTTIHQTTNHKDHQNCLFACFLSQKEPKKVIHALKDPSWIEAMQKELLQFKLQEVLTLVNLPYEKRAIGTKWVFRNKKDERGIMIRNKARIKAIMLFLAYAFFKDFVVYQMDVKSAFLYGKIEEEVYVCQPPGFEDPDFPDKVYKVEKALYGLHQASRAWYETLSTYLLDNEFHRGKIDKTLFIRMHKDDILFVQVYIDDIIFGSTKKDLCNAFEKMMHEKFQMSSMGNLHSSYDCK